MERLAEERPRLHPLPTEPYTAALGETRLVRDDQTVRWGGVRYIWLGHSFAARVSGHR